MTASRDGDHAFGGAADDGDLALGVEFEAVVAQVLGGDGVAEGLGAPGDGVLVEVGVDGVGGGVLEFLGRGEVGEALGEVDGAVAHAPAGSSRG